MLLIDEGQEVVFAYQAQGLVSFPVFSVFAMFHFLLFYLDHCVYVCASAPRI